MRFKFPCLLLLMAVLLAGCAAGGASQQPDHSPPPDRPTAAVEPVADKPSEPIYVDDPNSPYPLTELSWTMDMDGDGVDELVELRAEKAYWGNETEPDKWFEGTDYGLHPYTLMVTVGDTVYEHPLGRDSNDGPLLRPMYFPLDSQFSSSFWSKDRDGRPVLVLYFDNMSQGGAGGIDVYAFTSLNRELTFLPVPEFGVEATLDQEAMLSQVTVPETGYTETLDLTRWLADLERRNRENGYDFTFEPHYSEDGTLEWPVAPGHIDGFCAAERAGEGVTLWQYLYGSVHMDGMGMLVTTMSWENGEAVVLDQYFDWTS